MNGSPDDHKDWTSFGLADLLDRPIAFHRSFVTLTGSVNAALILSQAIYWQTRVSEKNNGWWYKSRAQWRDETGLSRREQETARKRLRNRGILLEERRGMPARIWYRVNRAQFSEIPDRPIAFHRCFVGLTGSVTAALVLSQAIYWQKRVSEKCGGWWYKTRSEWTEEIGLSRYEQESARKHLQATGVLAEEKRGMPARIWYRIDYLALTALLSHHRENRVVAETVGRQVDRKGPSKTDTTRSADANQSNGWADFPRLECTHPPIKTEGPKSHSWADFPHLDGPGSQASAIEPKTDCWADSPQQSRRWGKCAQQDGLNSPGLYKETETTTETTPPPQTPPQSARDRGGGEKMNSLSTTVVESDSEGGTQNRRDARPNRLELVFPAALSEPERQAAQTLVAQCGDEAQQILDVLAVIIHAGEVRKSPLAVLRGLVKRWDAGSFDASTGLHLAAARRQAAKIRKQVAAQKTTRRTVKKRNGPPPETIETFRRLRRKGRRL